MLLKGTVFLFENAIVYVCVLGYILPEKIVLKMNEKKFNDKVSICLVTYLKLHFKIVS